MSEVDERGYRDMVSAQDDAQIDTWAADLFIDFAKRLGVGKAIAAFCRPPASMPEASSGPSWSAGDRITLSGSIPPAHWPRPSSSSRRRSPGCAGSTREAREKLVDFLVAHREVMSYTA